MSTHLLTETVLTDICYHSHRHRVPQNKELPTEANIGNDSKYIKQNKDNIIKPLNASACDSE